MVNYKVISEAEWQGCRSAREVDRDPTPKRRGRKPMRLLRTDSNGVRYYGK